MFYDAYLELCNSIGKSPTAVGEILEISKGTISTWKSGKSKPTDKLIYKIADYFHVDFKALKEGRIEYTESHPVFEGIEKGTIAKTKEESPKIDFLLRQGDIETLIEFSVKYSQLTEVQKKLVSDLIDTFLSDSK